MDTKTFRIRKQAEQIFIIEAENEDEAIKKARDKQFNYATPYGANMEHTIEEVK